MKKVLLVDGHSIANRAFYGVPMLSNSQGIYTNAVYGFINILLKTIETEQPTHLAVAFDQKAPTFRHELYQEYKGTRKGMPDELHAQIPLIQEFLKLAGIQIIVKDGIEADDILGTIGKREARQGASVAILSGDRDLLQLAEQNLRILIPKTKKGVTETEIYTDQTVFETYGVTPEEFLQVKALMGDSSDNIPGVPSIGEKTAVSIIQKFHSVEEAISHVTEVKPPRAAKNLAEFAEQARLSLTLAEIVTHADISLEPLAYQASCFGRQEVLEFLKKYEFRSLLQRFLPLSQNRAVQSGGKQQCQVRSIQNLRELEQAASQMRNGFSYLLFEEEDELFGFWAMAVCTAPGQAWWIEEGKLLREDVLRELAPLFENPSISKTGHNAKEDMLKLARYGVRIQGLRMDTMIAAYLLNPSKESYTVDELAQIFLNESVASEMEVLGSGKEKKRMRIWRKKPAPATAPQEQRFYFGRFRRWNGNWKRRG